MFKIKNLTLSLAIAAFGFGVNAPQAARAGSTPFIGQIQVMGIVGFCPRGWFAAEGALLPISNYTALFSLLGTTYGGDGRTTFGLPDLRGRVPVHVGSGPGLNPVTWGQRLGAEKRVLSVENLPSHRHDMRATNADGDKPGPAGKLLGAAPPGGVGDESIYSELPGTRYMNRQMIANTGGNDPIELVDPVQVLRYCIAWDGIYPSRS